MEGKIERPKWRWQGQLEKQCGTLIPIRTGNDFSRGSEQKGEGVGMEGSNGKQQQK